MSEQKPYRVETGVDAPLADVWSALTTEQTLREWFGWDYEGIEPEIRQIFVDEATIDDHRLRFPDGSYLEAVADGGRTVVRAVLPGPLDDTDWAEVYDGIEEGWRAFLAQLRYLLERRPAGARRTVYLTGRIAPTELLGLLGDAPVWHDDRRQRAVVDSDGHLVLAAAEQPLDRPDSGPATITVSTYGLDDDAFAAVRDRWTARWRTAATEPQVTAAEVAVR
ncbi:SRPBCC domain-containing protein [Plantactinospora sp. GCM10030261]|uniref:SRPBCC family protein n=1 Tax=Plantactinospora sp. GCM10030261 TaxID=3273420 RepID=UPI003606A671